MIVQIASGAQERIFAEVMTGFGAVPKRGAEVGGILLGRVKDGTVWLDDVITIACEHRRGPSFLLSDRDLTRLEETWQELRAAATSDSGPVGIFRSHTRDQDTISDEDRELFAKYFPPPNGVFALIRPYATKSPTVSFLFYRVGVLPDSAADTFELHQIDADGPPMRRRTPGELRATQGAASSSTARVSPPERAAAEERSTFHLHGSPQTPDPDLAPATVEPGDTYEAPVRRSWLWIPASFLFLLLGMLLGFQSAVTFYGRPAAVADPNSFAAGLSTVRRGENLHIRWNREALAIRSAQRGTLLIQDGEYSKSVDLDASALQNGSVIYPPLSDRIRLRFEVTLRPGTVLIETLDWSKNQP